MKNRTTKRTWMWLSVPDESHGAYAIHMKTYDKAIMEGFLGGCAQRFFTPCCRQRLSPHFEVVSNIEVVLKFGVVYDADIGAEIVKRAQEIADELEVNVE